jgi:hypothetical protein
MTLVPQRQLRPVKPSGHPISRTLPVAPPDRVSLGCPVPDRSRQAGVRPSSIAALQICRVRV